MIKEKKKEIFTFKSEVKQLLHLMIHSLYSNEEVFLRELISNASDAIDKLRFYYISNCNSRKNIEEFKIKISVDKNKKELIISDNGIGMTKKEVIENLGTIAESGTKKFLSSISQNKRNEKLIGQFGVGFYSSFIVSNFVSVHTRSINSLQNESVLWESDGCGEYKVSTLYKEDIGTTVTLSMKEEKTKFLELWKLKEIISKYSNYISFPIEVKSFNEKDKEPYWEKINKSKAIWRKNKNDITETEYKEFYKYISNSTLEPLSWIHNIVEGSQEYTFLIYIPKKSSIELWNKNKICGIKIYVRRVFIMEKREKFVPNYLRFIVGIVDIESVSLNISREVLQNDNSLKNIRFILTKKILKKLENIGKNEKKTYQKFWNEFGLIFKEGPAEDRKNINTIMKLLRFSSTYRSSSIQDVSLEDYVSRMKKNQKKIYYITSDNYVSAKNSPHLEIFKKEKIEVLLLFDKIDDWMMNYLTEFHGKNFQLISKSDFSVEELTGNYKEKESIKLQEEQLKYLLIEIKKYLGERVKNVKFTNRLTKTPVVLTTDSNEMSTQMAKIFSSIGKNTPEIKYNFEINPKSKIIQKISLIKDKAFLSKWIELLLEEAFLVEKGSLEDPGKFVQKINDLLIELSSK
ncbi:heat-shock protein Hsp90 [Candidatus Riesia sp. GBBU]|nr:heat-shock protein Hsp90 [Candidatus Riesia sp. GBBU]